MSGRGRPAALPAGRHERERPLSANSLVVRHVAEDGVRSADYDFRLLPVSVVLRRELAEAFADRCGPDGTWRSLASSREVWLVVLLFARFLATLEAPPWSIRQLSPSVWAAFQLSRATNTAGSQQLRKVATLLRDHPALPGETRQLMVKRVRSAEVRETAYSDEEFNQLKTAAARIFRPALARIRQNREHWQRWRTGEFASGSREDLIGEALDHLLHAGELPRRLGSDGRDRTRLTYAEALGGSSAEHTWRRLFLNGQEACALVVLFVASYGWNVTPVMELKVPDSSPDAGNPEQIIHRVELEKRRRSAPSRFETRNLTDWGANSPGRLVTQALEATWPARETRTALGEPADRLIIWRRPSRWPGADGRPGSLFETGWQENVWHNRRGDFGDGARLNLRRLRRTVVVAHQRTPTQHTRATHDAVYLLPDPRTQADAAPRIRAGVADAISAAYRSFNAQVSRADTDPSQDTATTGCTDYHASPFSEAGQPCRASFLACTACPNAVVTPRHLPRLAYLHQVLGELRTVLDPEVWQQDWLPAFQRLDDLRCGPHFTSAEWADAAGQLTSVDRGRIDQLLRRGFDA